MQIKITKRELTVFQIDKDLLFEPKQVAHGIDTTVSVTGVTLHGITGNKEALQETARLILQMSEWTR